MPGTNFPGPWNSRVCPYFCILDSPACNIDEEYYANFNTVMVSFFPVGEDWYVLGEIFEHIGGSVLELFTYPQLLSGVPIECIGELNGMELFMDYGNINLCGWEATKMTLHVIA